MKILHVTHGLYPDRIGGVEVHTYELAKALSVEHEVTVFAQSQGPSREFALDGIRVCQVESDEGGALSRRVMLATLENLLRAVSPDVVHLQHLAASDVESSLGLFARVHGAGVPCVLSLHDYWYACPRGILVDWRGRPCPGPSPARCGRCCGWRTKNPWRWYARRQAQSRRRRNFAGLLASATLLAPVSEHVAARHVAFGVARTRMVVVRPGVPLPPAPADTPAAPAERFRIVFLGRLVPHKGVAVLLEAVARLRARAVVDVWGTGPPAHARELEQMAQALGVTLALRGAYDHRALDAILAPAHAVVVPSTWEESFGLVAQDALARRRVVIASRAGGIPEHVLDGVNGYLVPPRDPARLAEALDRVAAALGAGAPLSGKRLPAPGLGMRSIEREATDWSRLYALMLRHPDALASVTAEFEAGDAITATAAALAVPRDEVLARVLSLRAGENHRPRAARAPGTGEDARAALEALGADAAAEGDIATAALRRRAAEILHAHARIRVVVIGGDLGADALALEGAGLDVLVLEPDPVRADAVTRRLAAAGSGVRVVAGKRETSGVDAVFVPQPLREDGSVLGPARLAAEALAPGGLLVVAAGRERPDGFNHEESPGAAEAGLQLWLRR